YARKRRRAERSGSPLKELRQNAHEESSAVPDSLVPLEDDELPLVADEPHIQETPDQECTDGGKADFSQVADLTMEQLEHLENENRHLLSEVGEVRNKLKKQMITEDCLKENEDMLQLYTGLLEVLKVGMTRTSRNSLTLFQEMLIFLIRLRLNVPMQDLAYRFNTLRDVEAQDTYAGEHVTRADCLTLVPSGRFVVSHKTRPLLIVETLELLDSPEWYGLCGSGGDKFQVTVTAMDCCRVVVWNRDKLKLTISGDTFLQAGFENVVGKDVVRKLLFVTESTQNPNAENASDRLSF
ncbi:hypothetical protein MTO96_038970, partial [Rhipicephalus appendiculatus]